MVRNEKTTHPILAMFNQCSLSVFVLWVKRECWCIINSSKEVPTPSYAVKIGSKFAEYVGTSAGHSEHGGM